MISTPFAVAATARVSRRQYNGLTYYMVVWTGEDGRRHEYHQPYSDATQARRMAKRLTTPGGLNLV